MLANKLNIINRRHFFHLAIPLTSLCLLGVGRRVSSADPAKQVQHPITYSGNDLSGWEVVVGDGVAVCDGEAPVALSDIETTHHSEYSELVANVVPRAAMVHNISFKRFIDLRAFQYSHRCGFKFRVPYETKPDINEPFNGETVEGGIFIWDGANTRLDYGIAFQWVINPWSEQPGLIRVWNGNQWISTEKILSVDMEWHEVNMNINFHQESASLSIDGEQYPAALTQTEKPNDWGPEIAARLQAEIISVSVPPETSKEDCATITHRAEFKDWFWTWYSTTSFLPSIMNNKSSTPIATTLPTPTATPIVTATPTPDCTNAQITTPAANQVVASPITVRWTPDTCRMVLQFYQNDRLIRELGKESGVDSGTAVSIPPGRTLIKIWVPGASVPSNEVWIKVS